MIRGSLDNWLLAKGSTTHSFGVFPSRRNGMVGTCLPLLSPVSFPKENSEIFTILDRRRSSLVHLLDEGSPPTSPVFRTGEEVPDGDGRRWFPWNLRSLLVRRCWPLYRCAGWDRSRPLQDPTKSLGDPLQRGLPSDPPHNQRRGSNVDTLLLFLHRQRGGYEEGTGDLWAAKGDI